MEWLSRQLGLLLRYMVMVVALLLLAACNGIAEAPGSVVRTPDIHEVGAAPTPPPPLPTVPPAATLLEQALEQRALGDYEAAAEELRTLLDTYPNAAEARQARYYLAESLAQRGRWASAIEAFQPFLEDDTQDELTANALLWVARAYEETGEWAQAAAAYERYRALDTPLAPYATLRQAAQQQELGHLAEAAQNFEASARSTMSRAERAAAYERAIALRQQLGQPEEALRLYEELLELARLPDYRVRILSEAATLAADLGLNSQAHAWLQEIIAIDPQSDQAVSAVKTLLTAPDAALDRAEAIQILFDNGAYEEVLPLLDAAIAQAQDLPTEDGSVPEALLELQRMRAMAVRELGDFAQASEELNTIAEHSPDSEAGRQARLDAIQTLGQSGKVQQAAEAYRDYASSYPDDPRAPEALDRAAQLWERLGESAEATQTRLDLGWSYPESELARDALHTAAFALWGQGYYEQAQATWQQLANISTGYERAQAAFWAGRMGQRQQNSETTPWFEAAHNAAPNSYYGARAAEELGAVQDGTIPLDAPISAEEWHTLEEWVLGWSPLPDGTSLEDTRNAVAASDIVQRAVQLQQAGLKSEALQEWRAARTEWADDPIRLVLLAQHVHAHTMPAIELQIAEQLAALAPDDAYPLPTTLLRLMFPTPYSDLVLSATSTYGVDPRLLYALMRQESSFNPTATSWVGARGLTQVMPATGEGIAQNLDVQDFEVADLYQPDVSIRFGSYYIAQQIAGMDGSIQAGLAAYNGGAGNAQRWANGTSVSDADLFTETIDFFETRGYVKKVYGYYGAYRRLYAPPAQ